MRALIRVIVLLISIVVIALAWGESFGPTAGEDDGFLAVPAGSHEARVIRVDPDKAADPKGFRLGDIFDTSKFTRAQRFRLAAGADDGLVIPVTRRSTIVGVRIRTTKSPSGIVRLIIPTQIATAVVATVAMPIFAFLLLRRPSRATIALFFYGCNSLDISSVLHELAFLPDRAFVGLGLFMDSAFVDFPAFVLIVFLTRFPERPASATARLRMRIGDAIVAAAAVSCTAVAFLERSPLSWASAHEVLGVAGTVAALVFAFLAYRAADGESRQRIGWVLAGLVVSDVANLAFEAIDNYFQLAIDGVWAVAAFDLLTLALPISLCYAIVRHRVLDIGFALNRVVVFTTTSAILIGVFGGLQWLANAKLQQATLAQGFVIQFAIAVALLYVFRYARTWTEAVISTWLFLDDVADAEDIAPFVVDRLAQLGMDASIAFAGDVSFRTEDRIAALPLTVRGRVYGISQRYAANVGGDICAGRACGIKGAWSPGGSFVRS